MPASPYGSGDIVEWNMRNWQTGTGMKHGSEALRHRLRRTRWTRRGWAARRRFGRRQTRENL